MAVFGKGRNQLCPADARINRDDLAAWHGDVIGVVFGKVQKVAQHLPLNRKQVAIIGSLAFLSIGIAVFAFMFVNRLFELRTQRTVGVLGTKDALDRGPKAAATLRVSRG
jgi:hypothetical protein